MHHDTYSEHDWPEERHHLSTMDFYEHPFLGFDQDDIPTQYIELPQQEKNLKSKKTEVAPKEAD